MVILRTNKPLFYWLLTHSLLAYWRGLVDEENELAKIEAVGYKQGNTLFIHGEEYEL